MRVRLRATTMPPTTCGKSPASVSVFCQCRRDGDCLSLSLHDPRLQQLIAAWHQMPQHVKLAIEAPCRMPARYPVASAQVSQQDF